ncbi:MAG TPA: thioredoxin family protein [Thermoplasmata archaeon]|nr:thioredoxin family protein [Thermoplasmata archaeon]
MAEMSEFRLHAGDPAPEFALPGVDGKTYRLSDVPNDHLVLVVFWCNHCPYVRAWEGRMVELGRRYIPKGVDVFLINSNDDRAYPEDRLESMVRRAAEHGYPFPYLQDETQEIAHAYGALVTPHPMLFGRDRRLLFQGRIDNDHQHPERVTERYLERALDQALAGSPVRPAELSVAGCTVKWLP